MVVLVGRLVVETSVDSSDAVPRELTSVDRRATSASVVPNDIATSAIPMTASRISSPIKRRTSMTYAKPQLAQTSLPSDRLVFLDELGDDLGERLCCFQLGDMARVLEWNEGPIWPLRR